MQHVYGSVQTLCIRADKYSMLARMATHGTLLKKKNSSPGLDGRGGSRQVGARQQKKNPPYYQRHRAGSCRHWQPESRHGTTIEFFLARARVPVIKLLHSCSISPLATLTHSRPLRRAGRAADLHVAELC